MIKASEQESHTCKHKEKCINPKENETQFQPQARCGFPDEVAHPSLLAVGLFGRIQGEKPQTQEWWAHLWAQHLGTCHRWRLIRQDPATKQVQGKSELPEPLPQKDQAN